jgi:hypothetical protein
MARGDVGVQVKGMAPLRRALNRLEPEANKELGGRLREMASNVLEDARPGIPRLTGELAASFRISVTQRRVTIYSRLPQAPVVHWGGTIEPRGVPINFPRTDFLTRVLEAQRDELVDDVADAFDDVTSRVGWQR